MPRWSVKYAAAEFARWVAFRLPSAVVYHATIRLVSIVSAFPEMTKVHVGDIRAMDAVRLYERTFPKHLR